mgnify:CR=1 FL=1
MIRKLCLGGGHDARLNIFDGAGRVDQLAAPRFGLGDSDKALAQALVEGPVHVFIAVLAGVPAGGAAKAGIQIDVQY